jgi:hypothetical protein
MFHNYTAVFQKITFFFILFILTTGAFAQNTGDYQSVQTGNWTVASSWQIYNGTAWVAATTAPTAASTGTVEIRTGHLITFDVLNANTNFLSNGLIFINGGHFRILVSASGNQQYSASVNHFTMNAGKFIMESDNNPQLSLTVRGSFNIGGGELEYVGGGNNSSLYIDVEGDVNVTGGLLLNTPNLNRSGLYLVGSGTQNVTITSNMSIQASSRFFVASGSTQTINEIYNGNLATPQQTVFGVLQDGLSPRPGFVGLHQRTSNNNLIVNNSNGGVNLSTNRTVGGTLHLQNGTLFRNGNTLNLANNTTINRSGGQLNSAPTFAGNINLEYSEHSAQIVTGFEMPNTDLIQNLTITSTNGVKAGKAFTVNQNLSLDAPNPSNDYGLLEMVQEYGNYAQVPFGSANYNNSTLFHNSFDSFVLTMAPGAVTTGMGDVTGKIRRHSLQPGINYDFGNRNTRLTFIPVNGSPIPPAVNVLVSRGQYGEHIDNTGGILINDYTADRSAVKRLYQVRYEGADLTQTKFTLRMAYQESELNNNALDDILSWDHHLPYSAITPHEHGRTNFDTNEKWVELSNHFISYLAREGSTGFTKYWMISERETDDRVYWLGAADSDWNNPANWTGGLVPNNTIDVFIPTSNFYSHPPIITTTSGYSSGETIIEGEVRMRTLEIATTAELTVQGNALIKMYGGPNHSIVRPTVTSTDPENQETDVELDKVIQATFSELMNPATINGTTFTLNQGTNVINGEVTYTGTTASFTPAVDLQPNTIYNATITTGPENLAGTSLATNYTWNFTTASNAMPLPDLGTIENFGGFGGNAGLTNQGVNTVINNGGIGTTAAPTLITGFHDGLTGDIYTETPLNVGLVTGGIFTAPPAPGTDTSFAIAQQALLDAQALYTAISPAAMPGGSDPGAGELGGLVLPPGVYQSASGTFNISNGNLTLDAQGDPNAVWVFQTAAGLTVGIAGPTGAKSVILINGANAANVFWQVGSAATINAAGGGVMVGTIVTTSGVTLSTAGNTVQTVLNGRAISLVASVTMVNTTINVPN